MMDLFSQDSEPISATGGFTLVYVESMDSNESEFKGRKLYAGYNRHFSILWDGSGMNAAIDWAERIARAKISDAIDTAEKKAEHNIALRKKQEQFNRLRDGYGIKRRNYDKII